jgi:amino acid adenylation domain-containing protein
MRFSDLEAGADARIAGATSLDLLGLELDLRRETGRAVSLDTIDGAVTLAAVRAAVEEAEPIAAVVPSVATDDDVHDPPATGTQTSQWLAERLRPRHRGYLVPLLIELPEGVSWRRLSTAVRRVVAVRPALRTTIAPDTGEPPVLRQRIAPTPSLVVIEPRSVVSLDDAAISRVIEGLGDATPAIGSGTPCRCFGLLVEGALRGVLLLIHHAAVDDPSLRILADDLADALDGVEPTAERRDLATVAVFQRSPEFAERAERDLDWWRRRLDAIPRGLRLRPREFPTPMRRRHRRLSVDLRADLDDRLRRLGAVRSAAVLQAVRRAVRTVTLDEDDRVAIGVPMSLRDHPDLDHTVGMLLNTVPVPISIDDDLDAIANAVRDARRRRFTPYESIARGMAAPGVGRTAWLDVVVGVVEEDRGRRPRLPYRIGPTLDPPFPVLVVARFGETCRMEIDVDPAWIDDEAADRFADAVRAHLVALATDARVDDRSVVSGPVRSLQARALPELVGETAWSSPDAIALETIDGRRWTYGALDEQSSALAGMLAVDGRPIETPVAILAEPGAGFPLAVLGAMKAGGAAMPLPVEAPPTRLAALMVRARPAAVLVDGAEMRSLASRALREAGLDLRIIDVSREIDITATPPGFTVDPRSACYVLFTSGSTGEPKAVRMHHAGLAGLIEHERRRTPVEVAARTAQNAPLGFDVSFQELFSTWASGGTLLPVPRETRRDPAALARFLDEHDITRVHLSPLVLRALAAACDDGFPGSLAEIVAAGEALRIDDAIRRAAMRSPGGVRIANQYGPTETHVATSVVLSDDPTAWPALPSIGAPIPGTVVRIESPDGEMVTWGATGEIVIEGDAVALGYLDGPTGGFEIVEGRRRYRTGDLGRCREDGRIEYLGRSDEQVKISGYRVEPGEIEAVLSGLRTIDDAAVVSVTTDGDAALVAFVTGTFDDHGIDDLLREAQRLLPPWMVPARIVPLDRLPRSANGKVDRRALRDQARGSGVVARLVGGALGVPEILIRIEAAPGTATDVRDDQPLGILGVDSLAAIRLQIEFRERYGREVPIGEILGASLSQLRDRLRGPMARPLESKLHGRRPDPSATARDDAWTPLDPLVRDVLAEDAMAPPGAFHLAWTVHFDHDVSIESIATRLVAARRRHATLRTRRRADRGELVLDTIGPLPVDLEDFPEPPAPEDLARLLRHPLRVADGAPWRAATWRRADGGRDLLLVMHHVAVDGRTAASIVDEIVRGDDLPARPAPSIPRVHSAVSDDAWWIERVREVIGDAPLPAHGFDDDALPRVATSQMAAAAFRRAAEQAAAGGLPPVAPAVVAWALLLARAAGRRHAVVGVPFATDVADAGLGASILPIPVAIDDDRSIVDTVQSVGRLIADGLDHRGAALGRIIRGLEPGTSFVRPPLDGVLTRDDPIRIVDGQRVSWTSTGRSVFRAGLVVPSLEPGSPAAIEVEPAVLDGERPEDLLDRFAALLERIADDLEQGSDRRLGEYDGLRAGDRSVLGAFAIGDRASVDPDDTVNARFVRSVRATPDAIAVIDRDGETTYQALERWSAAIAEALVSQAGPLEGRAVAIAGGRDASTIAAMLGVVRAGGWFVPLDDDLPEDRRARQLSQVRPVAGIAPHADRNRMPGVSVVIDAIPLRGVTDSPTPSPTIDLNAPFYAMFTSGTTGEPRGAVIPHRAVVRLADDPWFLPGGSGFRMLHAAPLAFDASTLEIWWPLLNGGTVCCWEGAGADLPGIVGRVRRDRVDGCWLTAALFHAAVDGLPELFDDLSIVLTGGDVVSPSHVRRLQKRRPDLTIVDGYGPTENTVFTACESVVSGGLVGGASIPVGRPIRGTSLRILDASGRPAPLGRFGELVATGAGVGLGYLGADGRPEDRDGFDRDPVTGEPRYRTGDRVRWMIDGRLEFSGRLDAQVKIAGRRIELEAVETALRSIDGVLDACAAVVTDRGRSRLGAMIVTASTAALAPAEIRTALERRLPSWEVPTIIETIESIPATRNGKADRRVVADRLAATVRSGVEGQASTASPRQDELVSVVCLAVAEISGRPVADPNRSVRELGVDSLDLLRLALELENRVARPVRLVDVLEGGSPVAIADRIADDLDREHAEVVTLHPGGSQRGRSLYCIPGIGGTVFSFKTILDGLPAWLPVHGLPYPGTAGRESPIRRLDQLGAVMADRIRRAAPPTAILGYSLGGFAAFEAARLLAADGISPTVVVIDTSPAGLPSRRSFAARVTSARDWKMRFKNVLPQGVIDRLGGGGGEKGRALESLRDVVAAGFEAMRFHDPQPAPVDVVLVRTTETDFGPIADVADLGWGELARHVEVVEIPTAHLEVFRGGSMDLARVVRAVVERNRQR